MSRGKIYIGVYSTGLIPSGVCDKELSHTEKQGSRTVHFYHCWRWAEETPGPYGKGLADAASQENRERTKNLEKYTRDHFGEWPENADDILNSIL